MTKWLLVAAGGGAGSVLRYWVSLRAEQTLGAGWPYGTFAVNVLGSAAIGFTFYYWGQRSGSHDLALLFLLTGVLGGFTTFSAFSLETLNLLIANQTGRALAYASASVLFCVAGAGIGFLLARRLI